MAVLRFLYEITLFLDSLGILQFVLGILAVLGAIILAAIFQFCWIFLKDEMKVLIGVLLFVLACYYLLPYVWDVLKYLFYLLM